MGACLSYNQNQTRKIRILKINLQSRLKSSIENLPEKELEWITKNNAFENLATECQLVVSNPKANIIFASHLKKLVA